MLKNKTKEIIVCIIMIGILMLTIVTDVFATDGETDWNALRSDMNNVSIINGTNNTVNNTINNTINNTVNNTINNTANNTINNTANNLVKNNTTTIPNTGVDYSVVFIIAICGISSIFAYKKIKDYNNF